MKLITPQNVADQLGVSLKTVHRMISAGDLDAMRVFRRSVRIPQRAVDQYIQARLSREGIEK